MNDNPLLDFSGLPRFASIRPEHATPAVEALIAEARATIERVVADPRAASWESVAEPVADALDRLHRAWGALRHMNAVANTPALRDAYNGNLPAISRSTPTSARTSGCTRSTARSPRRRRSRSSTTPGAA
jgi:oligopeptidase A